jgi:probable F420-dependent oxidoreductase
MRIGVVFPQTEYGNDPALIRDYAQTVEALGFNHILAYDHVLGANPRRPDWSGYYTHQHPFHEPFVLFGYMAAATRAIELATGVLVLPQRAAALVAKQAAALDILSGGRLRLGVGIGWNAVEFTALNRDFGARGQYIEEQVEVMRRLWTQPLVQFTGRWHSIPDAGLSPLPVQRPIPVWFGGYVEATARRVARLGDGWIMGFATREETAAMLEKLDLHLARAGRARAQVGLEACIAYPGDPQAAARAAEAWGALGLTHFSLDTMGLGHNTAQAHLALLPALAEALALPRAQ